MKAIHKRLVLPVASILCGLGALFLLVALPADAAAQGVVECGTQWERPTRRENGDDLPLSEIGGYEVRVITPDGEQRDVVIDDPMATGFRLEECEPGEYQFQGAVFDTEGLYSPFIDLPAVAGSSPRPGALDDFRFYERYEQPADGCEGRTGCTVLEMTSRLLIYSDEAGANNGE